MQPTPALLCKMTARGEQQSLLWQSAHGWKPPGRIELADDTWRADRAYRAISQGTGLLWQGDWHQAKQMLTAIKRRVTAKSQSFDNIDLPARFHRIRLQRSQAARQSGLLLIEVKPGFQIELPRAPADHEALELAYGQRLRDQHFVVPLSELTGVISAFEWHRKGLPVAALGHNIYPRWGVFAPTRHEYLDLVMQAKLPDPCFTAVDVGTGTGVLSMLLAKRGVNRIIGTDTNPAAIACAQDNISRANLQHQIEIANIDLMPEGRFDLIVCNPPWLPGVATGPLEAAVYDPQHRMLRGFLEQASGHLQPHGQAWLILSDLADHLKLRHRADLLTWIEAAGLVVANRLDIQPGHRKLENTKDPLNKCRQAEVTSLWQLQLSSLDERP